MATTLVRVMALVERSRRLARLHHPVLVSMLRTRVVMPGSRVETDDTTAWLPTAAVPRREGFVRLTTGDLTMKPCPASS
jgi:hypothetical protein